MFVLDDLSRHFIIRVFYISQTITWLILDQDRRAFRVGFGNGFSVPQERIQAATSAPGTASPA
jgi:hypothetical protein